MKGAPNAALKVLGLDPANDAAYLRFAPGTMPPVGAR